MNNSKIVSSKITSAVFLAIVLVAGTFVLSAPSSLFMIEANAQGQSYYEIDNRYNSYEPQYPSYKPDYKPQYPSDNFKPKYSSYEKNSYKKDVSINKLKCINDNININGNNTGDINLGNKGQVANANAAEGYLGAYSYGSGEGYYDDGYDNRKKDKSFDCIINNNNNNTNIDVGGGNQTILPEPELPTATLNVTKLVTCVVDPPSVDPEGAAEACQQVEQRTTEDQFLIEVVGNYPDPSQFPGSESGTVVTLGPGSYVVTETPDESFDQELQQIEGETGFDVAFRTADISFTGDCNQFNVVGKGTIAEGESQTCNIVNTVKVFDD